MAERQWKASCSAGAFLAVTTCLLGQAHVYFGNPNEFDFYFAHAAVWLVPAAAILLVVVVAICELAPVRWRGRVQVLVAAIAACGWVQCSVLTWDYGLLDGTPIRWGQHGPARAIVD